jgi:23S rRNA (uridine2552-2'-O)-methyltransferase
MGKGDTWDDHYARRARSEKWLARSVYKLEEIDRKFRLLPPGARILDLGCTPGSWSQYALGKTGPRGHVIGVDLARPERLSAPNFAFIQGDVREIDPERLLAEIGPRDLVISDLAPKTTGVKSADASRSAELVRSALDIARVLLRPGGRFLCKVFEGEEVQELRQELSRAFGKVRTIRPKAVRKGSREIYLLAEQRRKSGDGP